MKHSSLLQLTEDQLRLIAKTEREMDAGSFPFVVVRGARHALPSKIMEALQLVSGQTVSTALMLEILKRVVAFYRARLKNTQPGDTTQPQPAESQRSSEDPLLTEVSDADIILLGQMERDMDAGRRPFVYLEGERRMVVPEVMEELQLQQGQTINSVLYEAILKQTLAIAETRHAVAQAQHDSKSRQPARKR